MEYKYLYFIFLIRTDIAESLFWYKMIKATRNLWYKVIIQFMPKCLVRENNSGDKKIKNYLEMLYPSQYYY